MNETQQQKQPFKPQQPTQKLQMPRPLSQMHKAAPAPRTVSLSKSSAAAAPMQ